jgi:hypothetical protein
VAPTRRDAALLRRMQDSHFQEVRRVTSLLLKLIHYEREIEILEQGDEKQSRSLKRYTRK